MSRAARWPLAGGIALLALPLALSDFWLFIAIEVLAFALYAVSFNVLLGYGGMLSFGHAMFFGLGAYAMAMHMKLEAAGPGPLFVRKTDDSRVLVWTE